MTTVAEQLVQRLSDWGVHRVFGYPGEAIHPVVEAFERAGDAFEVVEGCDEEMAAFMACGHAKLTDEVGVCFAPSGAPVMHMMTTLYEAQGDHQPLVAIVGRDARAGSLGEPIEVLPLRRHLAPECVQVVTTASEIPHVVDRAFELALRERVPSCIVLPSDLQARDVVSPREVDATHAFAHAQERPSAPKGHELRTLAHALNEAKRVAIVVGIGARYAIDDVLALAEKLGAGVADALLGVAVLPDELPYVTGGVGLLGTRASARMLEACDALLMIGTRVPSSELLPHGASPHVLHIDDEPLAGPRRDPHATHVLGDCGDVLLALEPMIRRKTERAWRESIEDEVRAWSDVLARRAMRRLDLVSPERVFHELSARLPERTMLACDAGNAVHWFARDVRMRRGMSVLHSGFLSASGAAIPYAIAAKLAQPDRPAIAVVSDASMQMRGLGELATLARHCGGFRDPRFVVVVLNEGSFSLDSWSRGSGSKTLFSYGAFAELLGLRGMSVTDPSELGPAMDRALSADAPVVLDVMTDKNVTALPPHVSPEQATRYALSMLEGDKEFSALGFALPEILA